MFEHALLGNVVYFVSSLTLEIYLVQYALFTDKMNFMFPLNIPVMYLMIFALAYVQKCLSKLFSQIFSGEDVAVKRLFEVEICGNICCLVFKSIGTTLKQKL